MKNTPFVAGTVLIFLIGITMNGTLALLPLMLQELMNYPVLTTGLAMASRGIGTMIGDVRRRAPDQPGRYARLILGGRAGADRVSPAGR